VPLDQAALVPAGESEAADAVGGFHATIMRASAAKLKVRGLPAT